MSVAFLFPGQGSQYVGMGKDFCKNFTHVFKDVFEEAGDVLGFDLQKYCFVGPSDQLRQTEVAQPAILTTSVAMERLLKSEGVTPNVVAGHSVGQFAALVAADVLTFSDALKIVNVRGRSMAAVKESGTMMAVVVNESHKLDTIFEVAKDCTVELSAYNSPTQVVFSGKLTRMAAFQQKVSQILGVKMKALNVSHGFHSSLMREMVAGFAEYVDQFSFRDAQIPIVLNCDAQLVKNKATIIRDIKLQCTEPVLWAKTIENLIAQQVQYYFEVSPSKTLAGFFRSFDSGESRILSCESVLSYKKMLKKYSAYVHS